MKNMDDLLKKALTPKHEPDYWFNLNTISKLKEDKPMKKMNRKKYATVALSCAFALGVGSISVYAAWKYLKPNEVIEGIGEEKLAEAFSEENSVYINETQSYGGYDVTLLGITSGENLTTYKYFSSDDDATSVTFDAANSDNPEEALLERGFVEQNDRTFVLFAIENNNQAFEDTSDYFNGPVEIFPVVEGYDYEAYMGLFDGASGGKAIFKDGVIYYMYECNNLEKYADHNIYMCVSDDLPGFSEYSYKHDGDFRSIARNEEYEGLNALFSLPLDPSKADPAMADAAIKAHDKRRKDLENQPPEKRSEDIQKAFDFVEQITPENINEYATPLTDEGAVQTFGPADAQGRITIESSYRNESFRTKIDVKKWFPDGETVYISSTGISNNDLDTLFVEHFKLNEDGTITLQYYAPKLPK